MPQITTQIEIAAPPEKVREVLLDFPSMPQWLHGPGITSVHIKSAPSQPGSDLQQGDIIIGRLGTSTTFEGTILSNTPAQLAWRGGLPLALLSGEHVFTFTESEKTAGGTTFTNCETFTGLLGVFAGQWAMGPSVQRGFEALNGDLKRRVESLNGANDGEGRE